MATKSGITTGYNITALSRINGTPTKTSFTTSRLESHNSGDNTAEVSIDIDESTIEYGTITSITINYSTRSSNTFWSAPTPRTGYINNSGGYTWVRDHYCESAKVKDDPKPFNDTITNPTRSNNGHYRFLLGGVNEIPAAYLAWIEFTSISLNITYTPHTCNWTSTGKTNPTCTATGSESFKCSICGATKTETIPAKGHTPGAAATCTTAQTCTVCGATITNALGHSFGSTTAAKAATCLATGNTAYKKCSRCNLYFAGNAATNATGGKDNTSSFVTNKLNHSYTGAIKSDGNGKNATHSFKCVNGCGNYGGAVTHTWNSGSVTTPPTCTASGVKTYTCTASGCGGTYTETIPANGHTEVTLPAVAATCTTTGLTEGKKCSVCNTVLVAQQTIPALGHSFTNYKSDNNATCTADGTKTAKCDRCDATNTIADVGSALGHSYISTVVKPTETSHGYTRHTCSRCGHYYDDNYTYLVRWFNEDGSVLLETDQSVPYGDMPTYNGATPTKPATPQYSYTHFGWNISPTAEGATTLTAVIANVDYYARFDSNINEYTVTWENEGNVIETDTKVSYGDMPDYNGATPTKASTAQYDYTFLGWSVKNVDDGYYDENKLEPVTGHITYEAVYLPVVRTYDLDIVAYDCTVDGAVSGTYEYGKSFTIKVNPDFGYEFDKIVDESNDIEYESDELTFIITGDTTLLCICERLPAPIFASLEQQVKEVYIIPEINTIVYVIDGVLPTLKTTIHTVDDLHFSVINVDIGDSKYANYQYYPIEQLYINDKNGIKTRIW